MNSKPLATLLLCFATPALVTSALASPVHPVSYSTINGDVGSYVYYDLSYTGVGNKLASGAPLSGGTGDLTDGFISNLNWFNTENGAGTGPYVGWLSVNPTIDFFFDAIYKFTSITFYFDDSNGAGGVTPPNSVLVNGVAGAVPDGPSGSPFAYTLDLTALGATNQLNTQIFARSEWLFLSEVTFEAAPATVPLPGALPLLAAALAGFGLWGRRRA